VFVIGLITTLCSLFNVLSPTKGIVKVQLVMVRIFIATMQLIHAY
jgi:hypothetical protein